MLAIELDGSIHDQTEEQEKDSERQANLEAAGYRVLRFRNEEVLEDLLNVLASIAAAISQPQR
jgi:very-short-patch-repair endonuclease